MKIIVLLGGKAATELHFNRLDVGVSHNIYRAKNIIWRIGNDYYANNFYIFNNHCSDKSQFKGEEWMACKLQEYYNKAKDILFNNKEKLDKLAKELMNKKVLLQEDIKEILG